MALYLGILLFSFIITSLAIIPFIDLLYRIHFTPKLQSDFPTSPRWGIPVGGGALIVGLTSILFAAIFTIVGRVGVYINLGFPLREELNLLFFTFISYGLLGLYDDLVKTFKLNLPNRYKVALQIILAIVISSLLFQNLHIHILHIPLFGVIDLGWLYIPLAASVILLFTLGFDISNSMDGLACGWLLIALLAFWSISVTQLDTPLSVFIALWVGSLIAFLYFNVYPARIKLGNSGSLSFGATLAVTGLLLGKMIALFIIGGLFITLVVVNFLQKITYLFFHRPLFSVTPLQHLLQSHGWPEPKVVMRLWLIGFLFAVMGLWFSNL